MSTARDLAKDQRGAVMVTGVFMGAFLIGATWLTFGIARAAIFRERVQETADAAAFSSAALHAKGMNLIAAINLVFFAITAIWVVLRTFEHIMSILQSTVLGNSSNCHGRFCHVRNPCEVRAAALAATGIGAAAGASVCRMAYILQEVRDVNKEARQTIGDGMDRFFPPLSKVQDVTARIAPAAGLASSVALGAKFGHMTIALSGSVIPGRDIANALTGNDGSRDPTIETPLGLPVVPKKFGSLCGRVATVAMTKVKDAFKQIPIIGNVVDFPVVKQVIDGVINAAASYIEGEFCGDSDWAGHNKPIKIFKERGPKAMFGHAENGADIMQIWAFTTGSLDDSDAPRVAVAGQKYGTKGTKTTQAYLAQGEFYFDCKGAWGDNKCNGSTDNAIYNMKWRARLRRLRAPNIGAELGKYAKDAVNSGPVKDAVKEAIGMQKPEPGQQQTFQDALDNALFDQAFGILSGKITDAAGLGVSPATGAPGGSYH